jgi:integrase
MRLMLKAGLRASEATALRPEHIDLMSGKLTVREGKGAKDRTLWVKNPALPGCLLPISSVPLGSAVIAQQHQYGNGGLPPSGSVWLLQNRISLS